VSLMISPVASASPLLVTASAAIVLARTCDVLGAAHAGFSLLVLCGSIRAFAVVAPAVRAGDVFGIVGRGVEDAADLGGSFHNDDFQMAIINRGDFLATSYQTEHAAFDRDALGVGYAATCEGFGCVGQFVVTSECGDV